jgi:predicted anti-sigma-YlaC factor YlaD
MNCEEARFKSQLLIDDELNEEEIAPVMEHIESCYKCREEYISFLKLRKKLSGIKNPAPEEEWFETLSKKKGRRFVGGFGLILLAVSYILLLGFALFTLFSDSAEGLFIKIVVAVGVLSVIVLFITALTDRIKESKTDKYKGVIK